MERIEAIAREKGYIEQQKKVYELTKEQSSSLFDLAFTGLLNELFKSSEDNRKGEASIATIYDHLHPRENKKIGRKRSREESNHE